MHFFPSSRRAAGHDHRLQARIARDLRDAGFAPAEQQAVLDTPAMHAQLTRFYADGGRIETVAAGFSGANGAPDAIRFYRPPATQPHPMASFTTLAHELGHALFFPEQWLGCARFAHADAYARSRELGEAHAWLNQYRLECARATQADPADRCEWLLDIENDTDFGTQRVDLFAHLSVLERHGGSEAALLDALAVLNANMFPCGMGPDNFKTYGQCNRWDWLLATRAQQPAFDGFMRQLVRPASAHEQKVLTKYNLFTQTDARGQPGGAALALTGLATRLREAGAACSLTAVQALVAEAFPAARIGVGSSPETARPPSPPCR